MAGTTNNTFITHVHGGTVISGLVAGGTVVQGNQHATHEAGQPPSAPSSSSQPSTEDWQKKLEIVQASLKEMYLENFKKTNPFSLPFTFDIENTWVALALREDRNRSQATENHAGLLKNAFTKEKILIIEGKPATGKTSLMRRLAYEWAKGSDELCHYDLIAYAEFREVREQTFESIADLVIEYIKDYIEDDELTDFKSLLSDRNYCKQRKILLLLDGYDESSLDKHCNELTTYLTAAKIKKPLLFNILITTRPGYLSEHRGKEGRYTFADVLGFISEEQKESYISSHFSSTQQNEREKNIAAICNLLHTNKNLKNLAESPLFLTFICLVHERIVDGTLVELYCNIIWWLIDRHQQAFPDRDIPALFGFQNGSSDKFETIQIHYLRFPQLLCLGNMALHNLKKDIFECDDCEKFNLLPVLEQVGLLRKERKYDSSFKLVSTVHFPHRTIQEFLAAFYCFCSNDDTNEWLLTGYQLNTTERKMNEFERFRLRIALSDKMPIQTEKRKYFFGRVKRIELELAFDGFNNIAGFNSKLLNWFLSQCTNVKTIKLKETRNRVRLVGNTLNQTSVLNESTITSKMPSPAQFSFSNLMKLQSVSFGGFSSSEGYTFETNSQLSFTNCPSMGRLEFNHCEMKSSTINGIATLPAIDTVVFYYCKIDLATWQSITDQIRNSAVESLEMTFGNEFNPECLTQLQTCTSVEKVEIVILNYKIQQSDLLSFSNLTKLHSMSFNRCTFEANSQLSFTNNPSLKDLQYWDCTFETNIQLSITNCPSLKILKFCQSEIESSIHLGIATLPAIDNLEFMSCKIDSATWLSITDQIRNSKVRYLQLTLRKDFTNEFLFHLQKCIDVEIMEITIQYYEIRHNELLSFSDLINIHSLTFEHSTFEASSQLSITNCSSLKLLKFKECKIESSTLLDIAALPEIERVSFEKCAFEASSQISTTYCSSMKYLHFNDCKIESSKILEIAILPAMETVEFFECKIDLTTWKSIVEEIKNASIKSLKLTYGASSSQDLMEQFNKEFLIYLQKCNKVEKLEIRLWNYKFHQNDLFSFSDLTKLHSLVLDGCTFEANSQLSFLNCPSLKNLRLQECRINGSTNLDIAILTTIDTLEFNQQKTDLTTWQPIIDQIRNISVNCLKLKFRADFNKEFLIYLQKCNNVEKMEITIQDYTIRQNDLFSFSDLFKLLSITFWGCTFDANSQLSFTNCPSLKNLRFDGCEIASSTNLGIATLSTIDTMGFHRCETDLATWQSVTDQIRSSSVKCLTLSDCLGRKNYSEFLHHLQKCERIEEIHVNDVNALLYDYEKEVTANLTQTAKKLPGLTSIIISDTNGRRLDVSRRLNVRNKERIEKAGQERNPDFLIKYVEESLS